MNFEAATAAAKTSNKLKSPKSSPNSKEYNFAIGDTVWAKVKGYPYWPAKIVEPISKEHQRNLKTTLSGVPTAYFVSFFGVGLSVAWVGKKDVEHYNCEQKEEYTKKSKSLLKLAAAVEEANVYENEKTGLKSNNEMNSSINEAGKSLLSIDEELQLIKGENESINGATTTTTTNEKKGNKKKSKTPKKQETKTKIKEEKRETEEEEDSSRKRRNTRLSVQIDQLCTVNKTSDEETESNIKKEPEENNNIKRATRKAPKRNHSALKDSISDDEETNKSKKLNTSDKENELNVGKVKIEKEIQNKMKFETCTLILDFKMPLVEHLIEKIVSFGIQLNIYPFNSNGFDDQEILKKYNLTKIENLELALKKDVVFSFLDSTNLNSFDKELFDQPLNDVKLVNLSALSPKNAIFYHHYFNDNNASFIEAPVLAYNNHDDVKIYASTIDELFFNSVKSILDSLSRNKVVYKGSHLGVPSILVSILQSSISSNQTIIDDVSRNLENMFESDESIRKYSKNDLFKEYLNIMIELFQKNILLL